VAVAGYRLLDTVGGEFFDSDFSFLGGEEDDAAGVGHEDRGARVIVMGVKLLNGTEVGSGFVEEGFEFGVKFHEAFGDGRFGAQADDAAVDQPRVRAGEVDCAIACEMEARVDA
jgi:hypothetical protein